MSDDHTPSKNPSGSGSGQSLTYRDSGVDIAAGDRLVAAIKPFAAATRRPGADAGLGGFGGLFDLKAAGFKDPILVSATDGVGTKLRIAIELDYHDTVGIDLVAMCVNDLVVQGAEPLFFLDYYATGKLRPEIAAQVVKGIAEGCRLSGCALIGGETAEMPGMYEDGDYDLAGFAVGAVERQAILPRTDISEGDIVLGLASGGLHSNGFSLVRRILTHAGLALVDPAPFAPEMGLGEALLTPTRLYVNSCLAAIRNRGVKALAHITGGGLTENLPRILPQDMCAEIDLAAWELPSLFAWLRRSGGIEEREMLRTFNCGVGMAVVVGKADVESAIRIFADKGETVFPIGKIVPRGDGDAVRYRSKLT